MDFHILLKDLRTKNGITQKEIADRLGVTQSTYAHYESGRRTPDIEKLRLIAGYYHLTDELLGVSEAEDQIPMYGKDYRFREIVKDSPIDLGRIYPSKQRLAVRLYHILNPDERVISAMLFGSSITMQCTSSSDTDISIRLVPKYETRSVKNEISESVMEACDWNADILWFDAISPSEKIYHDICRGVQIA